MRTGFSSSPAILMKMGVRASQGAITGELRALMVIVGCMTSTSQRIYYSPMIEICGLKNTIAARDGENTMYASSVSISLPAAMTAGYDGPVLFNVAHMRTLEHLAGSELTLRKRKSKLLTQT